MEVLACDNTCKVVYSVISRVPQKPTTPPDPVATATYSNVKMELEGFGAMDTQIGANEGQQLHQSYIPRCLRHRHNILL